MPEAVVRGLPGSGDQALLKTVLKVQKRALRQFDEQFDEGEAPPLTMAEAVAGLFSGELDPDYPFYGIAFEFVCASLGHELDNRGFVPCSVDLYPTLDKVLSDQGVPLRMTDLTQSPPIELPDWDDLLCGHWSAKEIRRGEPALAAAVAVKKTHPSLEVIHGWLRRGVRKPEKMLVGCHS
ncbi:MAG TPA: hypothetical protein VKE98_24010 [Gemmataceae bacterium]|nr:hypothetical protein [Gemmataceae bacterium]